MSYRRPHHQAPAPRGGRRDFFGSLAGVGAWAVGCGGGRANIVAAGFTDPRSLAVDPGGFTVVDVETTHDDHVYRLERGTTETPRLLAVGQRIVGPVLAHAGQFAWFSSSTTESRLRVVDDRGRLVRETLAGEPVRAGCLAKESFVVTRGSQVFRVRPPFEAAAAIATKGFTPIAATDSHALLRDDHRLSLVRDGEPPQLVVEARTLGAASLDDEHVVWVERAERDQDGGARVLRAPRAGGDPVVLAEDLPECLALVAFDGQALALLGGEHHSLARRIVVLSSGYAPRSLVKPDGYVASALAIDGDHFVWLGRFEDGRRGLVGRRSLA